MADLIGIIREVMTLTKSVGVLESDVEKLSEKVEKHGERILMLEDREELLVERMTTTTLKAVNEINGRIFEKLANLEHGLPSAGSSPMNLTESK
jgi:argininosuccinate synthase